MKKLPVNLFFSCLFYSLVIGCQKADVPSSPPPAPSSPKGSSQQETSVNHRFAILAAQWQTHCQSKAMMSDFESYLNTPSYRGLVALGQAAIPEIMSAYRDQATAKCEELTNCDLRFWNLLLENITSIKLVSTNGVLDYDREYQFWSLWYAKHYKK